MATKRAIAIATRLVGNKDGNSIKEGSGNSNKGGGQQRGQGGDGNKGGGGERGWWQGQQAMRAMARKRAMVRAARVMAMVTRVAGNKEGDGKGGKGNSDNNEGGGQRRG
jgi:hypothetical protein